MIDIGSFQGTQNEIKTRHNDSDLIHRLFNFT